MNIEETNALSLIQSNKGRYSKGSGKRPNRREKSTPFSNDYYVYDIESTKYEKEDMPILAYSYLHGIKKYSFDVNMTYDNINTYCDKYIPIRTNAEMEKFFVELNKSAIRENKKILIFVHNLTYEFYNSIFNMPLLHTLLEMDSSNVFALSSTKICKLTLGNLEIRDSLLLFGKSLKKCAVEVNMKKNEEHKTYNEVWTETSELPQWEYDYNEHDLDLVAVYFSKFVKMLDLGESPTIQDFINSKILTITGMVRYVCKKLNSEDNLKKQRCTTKVTQNSIDENTQKWIENKIFRGGFCKSVPVNTFCINKDVHSIDFASAYPAVMITGVYPKGKLYNTNKTLLLELDKVLNKLSTQQIVNCYWNDNKQYGMYNPFKPFIFKVRVKNLKIKRFNNKNEIGYLPSAKCEELVHSTIFNGSVYQAEYCTFSGTEYDFIIMRMFYTFEIDEILEEKTTTERGRLNAYKILNISKFAKEKEAFKKLSKIEKYEDFVKKLDSELTDGITFREIFETTGETPSENNMRHIAIVCNDYLMSAKNRLNSQYGISVQHQFQQEITYKNYQFEISEEETLHWSTYENYLQGIYVTAINRFRLLLMTAKLICEGFDIVYFDTDSIKLKGDLNKLNKLLEEWRAFMSTFRKWCIEKYPKEKLYFSNFGDFDYEDTYKYFMTQGSKRYITVDNKDVVHTTISGVNKIANSSGATLFYNRFGIEHLFKQWFGLNTLFDYTLSKRSINHIPTEPTLIEDNIIDNNGVLCKVKQYSCEGISEKDCGYLLSGFSSPVNSITWFYFYCYNLRGDKLEVEYKPHTIICNNMVTDEDGNILDCEFEIQEGFTIEKYDENLRKKWGKYFRDKKLLDYNEPIYQTLHDFKNGSKLNTK